jgi:surface polysaccharide O-acyltransferase-like enzyme
MNCLNTVEIASKQRTQYRYRYTGPHVTLIFVRLFALLWKTKVVFHEGTGGVEVWLHCFIISVLDESDGQLCSIATLIFGERAPESLE